MDLETTDTTATAAPTATTTTTAPAAPASGGEPAQGKTFTQDQLNAIVAQRLAEDRQRRAAKPAEPPKPPNGHLSADDVQRMLVRDRALTRAATAAGLTEKQAERMEAAMRADNPDDPAAWSKAYLEDMGIAKQATPTPTPTAPSEPAKPPAAAPAAPAGPVNPLTSGGLVDIFNLTHEQLVQLGPEGTRTEFEKVLAVGKRQQGAMPLPKALQPKR